MKTMIFLLLVTLTSTSAIAATKNVASMNPAEAKINVHQVADSILLGRNEKNDISVRLVSEYLGQSTDVSPRKNLFITFYHGAEMFNTSTAFALGPVWSLKSTQRLSAGVYEITFVNLDLKEKKMVVDTNQVFIDEANLNPEEMTDTYFCSKITVKE